MCSITVAAVLVDLLVGLDVDGRPGGQLRDPPLQGGADQQVFVLVDALELLGDAESLSTPPHHLHLPAEDTSCGHNRGGYVVVVIIRILWLGLVIMLWLLCCLWRCCWY